MEILFLDGSAFCIGRCTIEDKTIDYAHFLKFAYDWLLEVGWLQAGTFGVLVNDELVLMGDQQNEQDKGFILWLIKYTPIERYEHKVVVEDYGSGGCLVRLRRVNLRKNENP